MAEIKESTFTYDVKLYTTLSRKDADFIFKALETHPDTRRWTLQGEFAFSFVNFFKGEDVERDWSSSEIDKIMKALEPPYCPMTNESLRLMRLMTIWMEVLVAEYKAIKEREGLLGKTLSLRYRNQNM